MGSAGLRAKQQLRVQLLRISVLCACSVLQWLLLWLCCGVVVVLVQLVLALLTQLAVLLACALRTGGGWGAEGNPGEFTVCWCSVLVLEFDFAGVEFFVPTIVPNN